MQTYSNTHTHFIHSYTQDPREAILRHAEAAAKNPMFVGQAYQETQPVTILAEKVESSDEEE